LASEPPNLPTAVRAAETMTMSSMVLSPEMKREKKLKNDSGKGPSLTPCQDKCSEVAAFRLNAPAFSHRNGVAWQIHRPAHQALAFT
jgi:hypothetical protein